MFRTDKVFRIAFKAGISGFFAPIVVVASVATIEHFQGQKAPDAFLLPFQASALFALVVWILGTVVLWFEGWLFVLHGWRDRSWLTNALFVTFLIFFSFFAAYGFHILRNRRRE